MKTRIEFCKNKCCPVVEIHDDTVILGDKEGPEGITVWSKDQFKDFVHAVKNGKFDEIYHEHDVQDWKIGGLDYSWPKS